MRNENKRKREKFMKSDRIIKQVMISKGSCAELNGFDCDVLTLKNDSIGSIRSKYYYKTKYIHIQICYTV